MTHSDVTIRPAQQADCRAIADLFLIASDGLAAYIWEQVAEHGEDLIDTGTRRYSAAKGYWSYRHCLVADTGRRVVGMVHAFPMTVNPDAEPTSDPVLRPYEELEDDGSFYISGIAVYQGDRGRGTGTRLLTAAIEAATAWDIPRVSLICFEENARAMALYRRYRFVEVDRRPLVPHRTLKYTSGDALLLVRTDDRDQP